MNRIALAALLAALAASGCRRTDIREMTIEMPGLTKDRQETIVAALITAGFAFLGVYMSNRKQAALVAYRLEKLEEKVDKHNSVVERMYRLEEQVKNIQTAMQSIQNSEFRIQN